MQLSKKQLIYFANLALLLLVAAPIIDSGNLENSNILGANSKTTKNPFKPGNYSCNLGHENRRQIYSLPPLPNQIATGICRDPQGNNKLICSGNAIIQYDARAEEGNAIVRECSESYNDSIGGIVNYDDYIEQCYRSAMEYFPCGNIAKSRGLHLGEGEGSVNAVWWNTASGVPNLAEGWIGQNQECASDLPTDIGNTIHTYYEPNNLYTGSRYHVSEKTSVNVGGSDGIPLDQTLSACVEQFYSQGWRSDNDPMPVEWSRDPNHFVQCFVGVEDESNCNLLKNFRQPTIKKLN